MLVQGTFAKDASIRSNEIMNGPDVRLSHIEPPLHFHDTIFVECAAGGGLV